MYQVYIFIFVVGQVFVLFSLIISINSDTHPIHTLAFFVTVVPLEDGVVLVTFLAVHVGV